MMEDYFSRIESEMKRCYEIAREARKRREDPHPEPEIPVARDLAERVERLMGIPGLAEMIREYNSKHSLEETAILIGSEFARGGIGNFRGIEAVEMAVRTAIAILTGGVVAAPIDGIAKLGEGRNDDGTKFLKVYYAGPIRSAGGTAQALSVLVADYVGKLVGYSRYIPYEEEIERYIEEISLYRRIASLQYTPSEEEIRFIVSNCPVCIDGEPTEKEEVSGYRNLKRVETNRVRGGVALVIAEGLALKAPKIAKYVEKLNLESWEWIKKLTMKEEKEEEKEDSQKFMREVIAGRPVLSHPSRPGGFRLRYGRSRNTGFASAGLNPATMIILDEFIAVGTQLKLELPGKAAGISPVDSIEGPTVRLFNGDVLRVDDIEEAMKLKGKVEKILDLGEILINYGDFLENNHRLLPPSYSLEVWLQEVPVEIRGLRNLHNPTGEEALRWCEMGAPLHPKFTYLWHDISLQELKALCEYVERKGRFDGENLKIPLDERIKEILEKLLVPHKVRDELIIEDAKPFIRSLGLSDELRRMREIPSSGTALEAVNQMSGLKIRARAPTRIGARMGRPEKAKERKMKASPHVLFPVGDEGGRTRSLIEAAEKGTVKLNLNVRFCPRCQKETPFIRCECGERTVSMRKCPSCGRITPEELCPRCRKQTSEFSEYEVNVREALEKALRGLEIGSIKEIKGVKELMSARRTPEPLEKGILRALFSLNVFKDGTVRYDMTDLPLTHFKPSEIGVSVEKLRELGYTHDIKGNELRDENQILELRVQDVIISESAGDYLVRVAQMVDELLERYYGLPRYYNVRTRSDLVGHLIIGLAPHTSAGVLGRIIGFTKASVGYAHPYFHAAKRRNCDGDEDCVMLLLDALLNFSREYLPEKRGGFMDAPLVLTTRIIVSEVDGEVHNMDTMFSYPLEFYRAAESGKMPKEILEIMETVSKRMERGEEYSGLGYTHETSSISLGPLRSSYKTLDTMNEKIERQLDLARRIRAVDERDVAERLLISHFLPDLIGNLRQFSKQTLRCPICNTKYRRVPLRGCCLKCGSRLTLTVHEGSVSKYYEISLRIADEFGVSEYTKQRLRLIGDELEAMFRNGRARQVDLTSFI
ncbi:MAG: polymerase large subunit [Archaeoglobi archaeon]|nr:polymerase large subunit [Archaeoglobi archaeon]